MDFFDRVKLLVKQDTDLTLRNFIESRGINYETYCSGKRRNKLPRADEALRIAEALDTTIEYLITGQQKVGKKSNNARIITEIIAEIKEHNTQIITKLNNLK